ncbi:MAG: hypothetical protein ACYTF3_01715 [Planctomycetota bacterium]
MNTFDPMVHTDPSAGDLLRELNRLFRADLGPLTAAATVASLVALPALDGAAGVVLGLAAVWLMVLGVAAPVARRVRGLEPHYRENLRWSARRLPAAATAAAAACGATASPLVAGAAVSGALGASGNAVLAITLPLAVLPLGALLCAAQISLVEGLSPRASLRRSVTLARGRSVEVAGFACLVLLLVVLPAVVAAPWPVEALLRVLGTLGAGAVTAAAYVHLYHR